MVALAACVVGCGPGLVSGDAAVFDVGPFDPTSTDAAASLDAVIEGVDRDAPDLDGWVVAHDAAPSSPREHGFAAFALPGPSEPRYVMSAHSIEDQITGLVWEREPSAARVSLDEAHARCEGLELDGHDDYRVPSRIELVSIVRTTRSPTIDAVFAGTPAEYHWTRSLHPRRDASATSVYFGAAEIVFALVADRSAVVRCVRGGGGEAHGPERTAEGRIVDRATGLVWVAVEGAPLRYSDAVAACATRAMRVPSLEELASLVDDARTAPAIDLSLLGGEAGPTWSASEAQLAGERIGLDLSSGPSVRLREDESALLRCVAEAA